MTQRVLWDEDTACIRSCGIVARLEGDAEHPAQQRRRIMTEEKPERVTAHLTDEQIGELRKESGKRVAEEDSELQFILDVTLGINTEYVGNSLPMTLVMPGGVVAGKAITRTEWKKDLYDAVKATPMAEASDIHDKSVAKMESMATQAREELDLSKPPRRFIFLKDVTVRVGSTYPVTHPFMKVRVDAISAWSLGDLPGYQE